MWTACTIWAAFDRADAATPVPAGCLLGALAGRCCRLIRQIGRAGSKGGRFAYYEAWLAALESVLAARGAVHGPDLDEVTYQFGFGERDDVYQEVT